MKISKSNLIVAAISTFPWFLAGLGAESHLGKIELLLLVSTLSFLCLLVISISNSSLNQSRKATILRKDLPLLRGVFFWFIVISYIIFILNISYLIIENDFNLAYVRYSFFRSDQTLEKVFYGNKYIAMLFNWIIGPLGYVYIITIKKFSGKELIVPFILAISGFMLGGRFDAYRIAIIYLINYFYGNEKVKFSLKSKKIIIMVISLFVLFAFSIAVGANRQIYKYGSDSLAKLVIESLKDLYNYHSVQFPVIYSASDPPAQNGILTGLITPLYVISNAASPEGELYSYLDKTTYSIKSGGEANAFGTSIMFFSRFADQPIFIMTLMFFMYFLLFFYIFSKLLHARDKYILTKYLVFSLFFSAFTPYMFGFSWWFSIIMIFIYSRIEEYGLSVSESRRSRRPS